MATCPRCDEALVPGEPHACPFDDEGEDDGADDVPPHTASDFSVWPDMRLDPVRG